MKKGLVGLLIGASLMVSSCAPKRIIADKPFDYATFLEKPFYHNKDSRILLERNTLSNELSESLDYYSENYYFHVHLRSGFVDNIPSTFMFFYGRRISGVLVDAYNDDVVDFYSSSIHVTDTIKINLSAVKQVNDGIYTSLTKKFYADQKLANEFYLRMLSKLNN